VKTAVPTSGVSSNLSLASMLARLVLLIGGLEKARTVNCLLLRHGRLVSFLAIWANFYCLLHYLTIKVKSLRQQTPVQTMVGFPQGMNLAG